MENGWQVRVIKIEFLETYFTFFLIQIDYKS